MQFPEYFDVIVVGGGHAGTEAALAAARMGSKTLLLTHSLETLGQMSCNPSIGGIGKGHLVKEIDALGGAMAAAADEAGIQFRILNRSKGPAVRATRAQADRVLYRQAIRAAARKPSRTCGCSSSPLTILLVDGDQGGRRRHASRASASTARSVVLTAGTFLNGLIHIGLKNYAAGRAGDPAAVSLAARLKEMRLPQGRLENGHAAAHRRPHDRFRRVRRAAGRDRSDARVFFSWIARSSIRGKCRAGSRTPTSRRTK